LEAPKSRREWPPTSGVEGGSAGVQAHFWKFWIDKNLDKIPENRGRKCPLRFWLQKWITFAGKHMKTSFWRSHWKRSKWALCGKICRQKLHTIVLGKFGEIRAKILPTPKNLPAPTPMPPGSGPVYISCVDQSSHVAKLLLSKLWL